MTPGLFDLPSPLVQWLEDRLTALVPVPVSIVIWSIAGAILCLELYRIASPQERISAIRKEAGAAQRRLSGFDGELETAWPLIRNLLALSVRRVWIVLPATLLGAYPILVLLAWMSNTYGYTFPEAGEDVAIELAEPLQARWMGGDALQPPRIRAVWPDGTAALELPLSAAVPVVHKRAWWNWLLANPAGYLPADAPVEEIRIALPRQQLIAAGPVWLRGWEAIFLSGLLIAALAYKKARRIQ